MIPMDQWEWQANTPEFMPGPMPAVMPECMPGGMPGGYQDFGHAPNTHGFSSEGYGYSCSADAPYSMPSGQNQMMGYRENDLALSSGGSVPRQMQPIGPGHVFAMDPQSMGTCVMQPPMSAQMGHFPNGGGGGLEDPGHLMQLRAQYEWELQSKDQRLRDLQRRLGQEEAERAKLKSDFDRDRLGLMRHLNHLVSAVESYGLSVDVPSEDDGRPASGSWPSSTPPPSNRNGLDSKMEKLNNLLQHSQEKDKAPPRGGGKPSACSPKGSGQRREKGAPTMGKGGCDIGGLAPGARSAQQDGSVPSSSRAAKQSSDASRDGARPNDRVTPATSSKPRVSFPADLVQPIHAGPDVEEGVESPTSAAADVERTAKALEQRTDSEIDQQARETLRALSTNDALEALRRAEDLVHAQGDRCQNLSSILQSVCRKIKRRSTSGNQGPDRPHTASAPSKPSALGREPSPDSTSGGGRGSGAPAQGFGEVRVGSATKQKEGEVKELNSDSKEGAGRSSGSDQRHHKTSRDARESRSQPSHGAGRSSGSEARDPKHHHSVGGGWTTGRFEHLARQGAFILERDDESGGMWSLKIKMQELEPGLNDEDMQVYCRWLHHRLHNVRQELGLRSLRQLRTEVNFSKNGLTDDALARLLQALQRSELHVVCLNLYANRISPAGARHISDFLWEAAASVREIHLSHNEIDDEAALEMIRLLADHPKYQARRGASGIGELRHPVWLRLNNNWIEEPRQMLRALESELGITFCLARNRHTCGPTKCGWKGGSGCPLVHLYTFETQDTPGSVAPEPNSREHQPAHRTDHMGSGRQASRRAPPTGSDHLEQDRIASEAAEAQVNFPGRSSVVARVLANKLQSKEHASAQQALATTSPLDDSIEEGKQGDCDDEPSSAALKDEEEVLLGGQVMRDDTGAGSPTAKAFVENKVEANVMVATRLPSPAPSGVPEVTPEPDGQFNVCPPSKGVLGSLRGKLAKVAEGSEEEDAPSPVSEKKVKLMGPPKILQRGKAPPDGSRHPEQA